jgi:hypothetical protein
VVRGTFSPTRAWRPAVGARLSRTLGSTKTRRKHLRGSPSTGGSRSMLRRGLSRTEKVPSHIGIVALRWASSHLKGTQTESFRSRTGQFWLVQTQKPQCPVAAWFSCGKHRRDFIAQIQRWVLKSWVSFRSALGIGLSATRVPPNLSLKGRSNGGPPGPGRRYAVHFRQPGPGVPPLASPLAHTLGCTCH